MDWRGLESKRIKQQRNMESQHPGVNKSRLEFTHPD
jgi:hypothetical protein